jgi:hypothetical protein
MWRDIGYIPKGSQQPQFAFTNNGTRPIYISNTGIVLNQPVPTNPACRKHLDCKPMLAILSKLNWQGMPPPEAPKSPFQPMQYPPPAVLNPVGSCTSTTANINRKGGAAKLPLCEDFGGVLQYPSNNAPTGSTLSLVSYDTTPPPSGGWGTPSSGTVLWYISTFLNSSAESIAFNTAKKTLTVKSHRLGPSNTYSLYFYVSGSQVGGAEQLGSPNCSKGACVLTAPSPLDGETLPVGVTIWFEVVQN